ncbi:MAG: hypothetical protein ACLFQM_04855 [Fidelibacterota bacterium]
MIDTLLIRSGAAALQLSKKYVIPQSLAISAIYGEVTCDSMKINALKGRLTNITTPDSALLTIKYQYLSLDISENTVLYEFPEYHFSDKEKTIAKRQSKVDLPETTTLDFLKSGSLYRGVSLASESGASIQSGLNLELRGKITDDMFITGALSDQNIPIQPEGNTQSLNEIDKVFINLEMDNENIIFGDYNLDMGDGKYGTYQRKLQGIYGQSKRRNTDIILGGAVSKGEFTTNRFNGEEGNQGPYQLTGKEGETAIIVLAGTETVWIDGRQLTRGENHDYTIDYSTGEISFTARQLITSDSRVTVDFQYSNLVYQKNIWYSGSSVDFADDRVKVSAAFIKEADDKNNPIEFEFNADDRQLLKTIGDDVKAGYKSTITPDSNGVYILEDSILVYQGPGAGTHSAVFYNVGKKGRYRKIYEANRFYFQWVDKNDPTLPENLKTEAVYLPAKPVKLPKDQQLYHVVTEIQATKNLYVSSEFAQSNLDMNTFSSIDDSDNRGHAFNLDIDWAGTETSLGKVRLNATYNQETERFNPIDRNHVVEYARKWDIDSDSTQGARSLESLINYSLKNNVSVDFSAATFDKENFSSNRYKLSGRFHFKALQSSEFYEEKITSVDNRQWLRRKASVRFDVFNLSPYSTIYYEKKDQARTYFQNFQFLEQSYGLESDNTNKFQWRIEKNYRHDESDDTTGWATKSKGENLKLSALINDWKTLSSKMTFANRKKKYAASQNLPDVDFSIMAVELRQNPRTLPFSWETNMKVEKEQSVKKEKLYYYVGEGKGQYRYDSTYAEYVPHAQGAYLLRIIPSAIKTPVTNIENDLRLRFNGYRLKNSILKGFSLMSQIRLKQELNSQNNALQQWSWHSSATDTTQAFFYRLISNDLNYRIPRRRINIKLHYRTSLQKSQLDVRGAENSEIEELSCQYRGPFFARVKLQSELAFKETRRISFFNDLRNRDILSVQATNNFTYNFNRNHLVICEFTLSKDRQDDKNKKIEAFLTGLELAYEIKILKKGRWKFFTEYNNVTTSPETSTIPWEMCDGNQVGNTFGIGTSTEYKIGKYLSVRGNYESRREPYLGIYHRGNVEIRAMF